jgi:hypothetical protein
MAPMAANGRQWGAWKQLLIKKSILKASFPGKKQIKKT